MSDKTYKNKWTILQAVLGVVVLVFGGLTINEMVDGHREISGVEAMAMATEDELLTYQEEVNKMQEKGVAITDPFKTDKREVDEPIYIGRITIPKIKVNESIIHGTSPDKLKKGVGIMEGSDIPLGNTGESSIIAGHNGYLWRSTFFWNLKELDLGDEVIIELDNQTLTYQVVKVSVVNEDEVENVMIEEDNTLLALVTSKPFWVTKERLLVEAELVQ